MDLKASGRLYALVIGQERLPVCLLAHVVLHVPGACALPVPVVPVLDEGVHHGADVVQDIRRLRSRCDQAPHPRVVPEASGAPDVESSFGRRDEPQVPERGVRLVGRGAGECDLQLPRELHGAHHAEQVLLRGLGVGIHIEMLSGIDAGQRCRGHVARVVPASALRDYPVVQCLVHDIGDLVAGQVVELHRLAGGGVYPADPVIPHDPDDEVQLVLVHMAPAHAEPDHAALAPFLSIAAEPAGYPLVVLGGHLSGEEPLLRFPELGYVPAELLDLFGFHSIAGRESRAGSIYVYSNRPYHGRSMDAPSVRPQRISSRGHRDMHGILEKETP